VIGNRLAELPEIQAVASYASNDVLLASTGALNGPQYSQPVTIDDSTVGYVRVALRTSAFTTGHGARWTALIVGLLLVPFAVATGWSLARALGDGRLRGRWDPPWREISLPEPVPAEDIASEHPVDPPGEIRHYLLAVNLYNQFTLQPNEREFELSLCTELAEAVVGIYHGQVVTLPGVGALVDFDHTEDADRPFEVLCAAFVLARLLRDEAPFGHYRLGLNVTERPADETLPLDDEAIADAALLSALARDLSLAMSATFVTTLSGSDRLDSRPLINPLLDELATSPPGCSLATGLTPPYAALVVQQAQQLASQRDAISSPSTF
jgi:hypothetical protein